MSTYFNDPREMTVIPESGITLEEDNRFETMYHWGAKVTDLCDLPVSEYMKPMTVIVDNGGNQSGDTPDHEYVDLGLPSGTLWAKYNVGASTPDEAGLFFAWGEISGYTTEQVGVDKTFSLDNYKWYEDNILTKYTPNDGKTELDAEDDAAIANWGSKWQMPTSGQCQELFDNTTQEWNSERSGYTFTSSNGNELFFFAGGKAYGGTVVDLGTEGFYLSNSVADGVHNAFIFDFQDNSGGTDSDKRYYGHLVRPVLVQD